MTKTELELILAEHKKYVETEGKEGTKANLKGVNLKGVNLGEADLSYANLRGANLRGANLRGVSLFRADLGEADLGEADLRYANIRYANLRGADLVAAELRNAELRNADLGDVDLDFSSFPLWCGSLDVHIDEHIVIQLLYHLLRNVQYSSNISDEMKSRLLKADLIEVANRFHRVDECGMIK